MTMRSRPITLLAGACALGLALAGAGCGGGEPPADAGTRPSTPRSTATAPAGTTLDRVVRIAGGRGLYVRCTGSGAPTLILEGGDEDTSASYAFAESLLAGTTRTCVYDRANLGRSDPAPGPRGLDDLVGDLEGLLQAAAIPGPYVVVGTSGGGSIAAGFAYRNRRDIAGLVFIDTGGPYRNPPKEVVEETDPANPANVEKRDYLQVENDAWAGRRRIGDIPVTIVSVEYSAAAIQDAPFASERRGMRRNVLDQRGWLVLSPRAKQRVAHTGHAVEEEDPELVIDTILGVVRAARAA